MLFYTVLITFVATAVSTDSAANGVEHEYLFRLAHVDGSRFAGGAIQQADELNFPILKGQFGSMAILTLKVGGVRQPHWHPFAWELNYVVSGKATWTIVGTNGNHESFVANAGDLVFIPRGLFHYFANGDSEEELKVLIVFNSSQVVEDDDIGIVPAFNRMPLSILAASFDMPEEYFKAMRRNMTQTNIILRKAAKGNN